MLNGCRGRLGPRNSNAVADSCPDASPISSILWIRLAVKGDDVGDVDLALLFHPIHRK